MWIPNAYMTCIKLHDNYPILYVCNLCVEGIIHSITKSDYY